MKFTFDATATPTFQKKKSVLIHCALMYALQANIFCNAIRALFDAKTPLQRRLSLLHYIFKSQNFFKKALLSHLRQSTSQAKVQADQPLNDPVVLPERGTNPEWERS